MILRFLTVTMMLLTLSSCGEAEYTPPYLHYRADFDTAKVDEAEMTIKEIAKKWNLRVYEKDRDQMKFLTQGKEAFFIALYRDEDPVLSLTNSGVGNVISVMAVDYGNMPVSDLERLTKEVIKVLEERLNIEFKEVGDSTASIDIERTQSNLLYPIDHTKAISSAENNKAQYFKVS